MSDQLEEIVKGRRKALQDFLQDNRALFSPTDEEWEDGTEPSTSLLTGAVLFMRTRDVSGDGCDGEGIMSCSTPQLGYSEQVGIVRVGLNYLEDCE